MTIHRDGMSVAIIVWGNAKNDYRTNGGCIYNYSLYEKGDIIGKIVLEEGWLLDIHYAVIFRPAQRLGF